MTPGKCTVVELNPSFSYVIDSPTHATREFSSSATSCARRSWETGPLRKVTSPVLLPPVAGNLEGLSFEYMLVLFNEICSFRLLDTTRYKCF